MAFVLILEGLGYCLVDGVGEDAVGDESANHANGGREREPVGSTSNVLGSDAHIDYRLIAAGHAIYLLTTGSCGPETIFAGQ